MAWPSSYTETRLNPWPIKYLMPAVKWFPLYWPNAPWEIRDLTSPTGVGQPPDGAIIPWWKLPKNQWPVAAPWSGKVFGAWPASQVTMSEDLAPSIWPGGHRTPPFGFIKLKMPGQRITSGNQIAFMKMRMYMRPDIAHVGHHLRIMSRNTPMGQQFYFVDKNWDQYTYDYRQFRALMRARRRAEIEAMLEKMDKPITPKPSVDLFGTGEKQVRPMKDLFL